MKAEALARSAYGMESARKAKAKLRRNDGLRSEELLETALLLFSEEGYRDVTIQRIADRLQVRHSLIYYYFESKEKLFHSALVHAVEQLTAKYGELTTRHNHPVDLLNDWFRLNIEQAQSLRGLINIMIDHASNAHSKTPRFVDDIVREFYANEQRTLAGGIRRGVAAGIFSCKSPDDMATFISRGIDGIYYGAIVRRDTSIPDAMEQLRGIVWELLQYRPKTRRKGQ